MVTFGGILLWRLLPLSNKTGIFLLKTGLPNKTLSAFHSSYVACRIDLVNASIISLDAAMLKLALQMDEIH